MTRFTLPNGRLFEYQTFGEAHERRVLSIATALCDAHRRGLGLGTRACRPGHGIQEPLAERHGVSSRMVKRVKARLIEQCALA